MSQLTARGSRSRPVSSTVTAIPTCRYWRTVRRKCCKASPLRLSATVVSQPIRRLPIVSRCTSSPTEFSAATPVGMGLGRRIYLAAAASRSRLVNVVSLVGHGTLRIAFAGTRLVRSRTELDAMENELDESLAAGACGLSRV